MALSLRTFWPLTLLLSSDQHFCPLPPSTPMQLAALVSEREREGISEVTLYFELGAVCLTFLLALFYIPFSVKDSKVPTSFQQLVSWQLTSVTIFC